MARECMLYSYIHTRSGLSYDERMILCHYVHTSQYLSESIVKRQVFARVTLLPYP